MNLIEALKTNEKVRRASWSNKNCFIYKNPHDDLLSSFDCSSMSKSTYHISLSDLMANDWGNYDEPSTILNCKEVAYLEIVLRPFKEKVKYIVKQQTLDEKHEYIDIWFNDNDGCTLPFFEPNTMYKNMKVGGNYTPKELGLFKKEQRD